MFDHLAVCSEAPSNVFAPSTHTLWFSYSPSTHNARWTNAIISFPQYFSIILILILLPLLLLLLLLLLTPILISSSSCSSLPPAYLPKRLLQRIPMFRRSTNCIPAEPNHVSLLALISVRNREISERPVLSIFSFFVGPINTEFVRSPWLLWSTTWGELFLGWRYKYPKFVTMSVILRIGGRRKGDCGW